MKHINNFRKPVFYSSFSFLFPELDLYKCFDKNLQTSCSEFVIHNQYYSFSEQPEELKILPGEIAIVREVSPSHRLNTFPPEKNPIIDFRIYFNEEDLKNAIPKKIRLVFYEQKLYHINNDFRFPDQPEKIQQIELKIQKKSGWQIFQLPPFKIEDSFVFPKNMNQRWAKIIIDEVYPSDSRKISIGEIYFYDNFLYKDYESVNSEN